MQKNKIYISGKITGLTPDEAKAKFAAAEKQLIEQGFEVVNPCSIEHNHDNSWEAFMRNDIKAMMDCTHIYMLDNWNESPGAKIELNLAIRLNYKVTYQ